MIVISEIFGVGNDCIILCIKKLNVFFKLNGGNCRLPTSSCGLDYLA